MSGLYFFSEFTRFDHNPDAPISAEFQRLANQQGWSPGSKTWRKHWSKCIAQEYEFLIGRRANNLLAWQALCSKLDLVGNFDSINKCRKALNRVNVNIVDLLECWDTPQTPRKFRTVRELAAYTKAEHKIFGRNIAKQDKVLRVLLKKIA